MGDMEFNPFPPNCWHKKLRRPEGPLTKWRKLVAFWIPRRYVDSKDVDVPAFMADLDAKIEGRGFVLSDGQILSTPLSRASWIDLSFEGDSSFDVPPRRPWGDSQRRFFGLDEPYQMAEEPDAYCWSRVGASIPEPYLTDGELVVGLLHGEQDGRLFYCSCHQASVVYTTRHRLVCMSCGATHVVLETPLPGTVESGLTAEQWSQLFDVDGTHRDADVELSVVDFQEIEDVKFIWSTSQWEEAVREFILYARSSSEEIDAATRGSESDPLALLEAGFKPIEIPPPPAFHVLGGSVDVGLLENAENAFVNGFDAYLGSFRRPTRLLMAIPDLFRAIELVLKARLEQVEPGVLVSQPNTPTVLARLEREGVNVTVPDRQAIDHLRRLRNDLQHGGARFNHRQALRACRAGISFLDRFLRSEFGIWIGDALPFETRAGLLDLPEIADTAQRVLGERLDQIRKEAEATVEACDKCGKESLVRSHPSTGASCIYCGHVPIYSDVELDD